MSEARVGYAALGGGADRLVKRLPTAIAMGLLPTGRHIEPHPVGPVTEVAPASTALEAARHWAAEILLCSPIEARHTKELALAALEGAAWTADRIEHRQRVLDHLLTLDDTREGVAAFTEKRAPRWTGR